MKQHFRQWILTSACMLCMMSYAHSAIAVSNIDSNRDGGLLITQTPGASAMSFTTGLGTGWTLESIRVDLSSPPSGAAQVIDAFLYADSSGLPGSSIALIGSTTPLPIGNAIYTIDAISLIALMPNTTYWLVLSRDANASMNENFWGYTFSTDQTSAFGDWTIGDTGVVDYNSLIPQGWETPDPQRAFRFEINAVPEPSVPLLGALGSLLVLRRRR
jgi:hypothetical protein